MMPRPQTDFIARRPIRKRERRAMARRLSFSIFGTAPRDIGAIAAQWRNGGSACH